MKKLAILLVTLLLISSVSALKISPGKTEIKFEPNKTLTFPLRTLSEDGGLITLGLSGELEEYVTLSATEITGEDWITTPITISLPESLNIGRTEARIVVSQPSTVQAIGAQIVLIHRVIVNVPPEFARVYANVNATLEKLILWITNPREKPISNVDISLQINEQDNEVFNFVKRGIFLSANTTTQIPLNFSRYGEFSINYTLNAAGEVIKYTKPLLIGKNIPQIMLLERNFSANKVNAVTLNFKNNWNKDLTGNVRVFLNREGKKLWNDVSQDFTIPKYGEINESIFIDATNVVGGPAELTFEFWYGQEKVIKQYTVALVSELIVQEETQFNFWPQLISAIFVIIMIIFLLYFLRSKYI